jgi:hypothetical protein
MTMSDNPNDKRKRRKIDEDNSESEFDSESIASKDKRTKSVDTGKKAKKEKADKPEKPKEIPLWKLDRGKWRGGTTDERIQRIRWILTALWRTAPYWLVGLILLAIFGPKVITPPAFNSAPKSPIAPFFTREVQYWAPYIARWSQEFGVDANLIATLMQIESCGLPLARSTVGAQGLFQVMPMHFEEGENMTDPDTNARRGIGVIRECLGYANGDAGLAMACYNGGPSLVYRDFSNWPTESQNYYTWGLGIYADAATGKTTSASIDNWLNAGGVYLCEEAATTLNLPTVTPGGFTPRPTTPPTVIIAPPSQTTPLPTYPVVPPGQGDPGGLPTFAIDTPAP